MPGDLNVTNGPGHASPLSEGCGRRSMPSGDPRNFRHRRWNRDREERRGTGSSTRRVIPRFSGKPAPSVQRGRRAGPRGSHTSTADSRALVPAGGNNLIQQMVASADLSWRLSFARCCSATRKSIARVRFAGRPTGHACFISRTRRITVVHVRGRRASARRIRPTGYRARGRRRSCSRRSTRSAALRGRRHRAAVQRRRADQRDQLRASEPNQRQTTS